VSRGDGVREAPGAVDAAPSTRARAVERKATGKPSTTDGALGDRRAADEKYKGHRNKRTAAP
jgi:hypothetical protein